MSRTADRIAQRMAGRKRGKDAIYTVVTDDHSVICHTEATLDTWWAELAPEDKARLYELHLDGVLGPESDPRPADAVSMISMTACGLSPKAVKSAEFLAGLAEVASAARIMLEAREVLDARGAAIHG
jgi:hypothetical protein